MNISCLYFLQDGSIHPFETFLRVMEQTHRPTCSLVLPVAGKLINMLSHDRKVSYTDYSLPGQPRKITTKVKPYAQI